MGDYPKDRADEKMVVWPKMKWGMGMGGLPNLVVPRRSMVGTVPTVVGTAVAARCGSVAGGGGGGCCHLHLGCCHPGHPDPCHR